MEKKGDISITVIIVAAIALIVLVVLVMIFTGRMGIFKLGLEKAGEVELMKMKINYGDCHPATAAETSFADEISKAESEIAKEVPRTNFKAEIERCKSYTESGLCSGAGCSWK